MEEMGKRREPANFFFGEEGANFGPNLVHPLPYTLTHNYTPSPNVPCVNQIDPNQHLTPNFSTLNHFKYFSILIYEK